MSSTILVFKSHKVNVSNLIQYHIGSYYPDLFYKSCWYYAVGKFLFCKQGEAATILSKLVDTDFRTAKWDDHIAIFKHHAEQARIQNKFFMFGLHDNNQIELLRQEFGVDVTVIAINYGPHLYQYLLNNMAQYHLYMLTNNILEPTVHDLDVLKHHPIPVQHYVNAFDDLGLLPQTCSTQGDYNINIDDFFDFNTMCKHFEVLGFPLTEQFGIYHQWHQAVSTDMDVPCLTNSYCSLQSSGNTCRSELAYPPS